jgi:oxygen-independent coproporphyrinogen-3 oxidase
MINTALRYASRPAPRYTSYPTAPHFNDGVTERTVCGWLGDLPAEQPVSLYLHVPFCHQICWYCGCNKKLASRYGPVGEYLSTMLAEIDLAAAAAPKGLRATHVHWGGGTPTTAAPDDLRRTMEALRARFTIDADAELAIEIDPRTFPAETARALGAEGFTRASFGVQEFDPKVQAAINRVQPFDMVARVVGELRDNGVEAVNFDLMYGLPHQTVDALTRSVEQCVTLRPDRIALFGYAHVPWFASNQKKIPDDALPGPEDRLAQEDAAARLLVAHGYQRIGLDHFALPEDPLAVAAREGRLRRNFQGYTDDDADTLIGFGASSISSYPKGYAQNFTETGAWARAIGEGRLPIAKGRALFSDDRMRRELINRLMCDLRADTAAIAASHGETPDIFAEALASLAPMAADGLVALDGPRVAVTEAGRPALRAVAAAFDAYLGAQNFQIRHSSAV